MPLLALAAAAAFAGGQTEPAAATGPITIRVWDHFQPLTAAHDAILDAMKKRHPNLTVEHTVYNPATMPEALQLAFKSGQLPDVTSNVTGVPASKLIDEGWYVPIDPYVDVRKNKLVADQLFEGLSVFKGKVYTVPIFSQQAVGVDALVQQGHGQGGGNRSRKRAWPPTTTCSRPPRR